MENKGYRGSVTLLLSQGSPHQGSLRSVHHAPPCGASQAALPEFRREKVREDSGVFLHDSCGQCGDPHDGLYGKFAGILQGKLRRAVDNLLIIPDSVGLRPTTQG